MAERATHMSFERDIKPLFREIDRQAMDYVFDLWDYDDVREYAQSILEHVETGRMPCDSVWPAAQVDTLRRWVDAGMPR